MISKPLSFLESMRLPVPERSSSIEKMTMLIRLSDDKAIVRFDSEDRKDVLSQSASLGLTDESGSIVAIIPTSTQWEAGQKAYCQFSLNSSHSDEKDTIVINGVFSFAPQTNTVKNMMSSWRLRFLGQNKLNKLYRFYGEDALLMIESGPELVKRKLLLDQKSMERLTSEAYHLKRNWHGISYLLEKNMTIEEADLIIDLFSSSQETGVDFNPFMMLKKRRSTHQFKERFFEAMNIKEMIRDDPGRAISMYVDMRLSGMGDTAIEFKKAIHWASQDLGMSKQRTEKAIHKLISEGKAEYHKMWGLDLLSMGKMHVTENEIAIGLGSRQEDMENDMWVEEFEPQSSPDGRVFELAEEQKTSVQLALSSRTSVITGGPGTGKTTIIHTLIKYIRRLSSGGRILLACPTGKAARRMTDTTGEEAYTLHRLMGMTPDSTSLMSTFDETDTLILDEASLMDINLLSAAIRHTQRRGRLVLIGDPNQIASIDNGSILSDIILSRHVPVSFLSRPQRYELESDIDNAAYSIIQGEIPNLTSNKDFHFIEVDEEKESINKQIYKLVSDTIPNEFGISKSDIQILAAMRKGQSGINKINEDLKPAFNEMSLDASTPSRALGNQVYHLGDRIMQLKNRYDLDIQNGESGIIVDFDDKKRRVLVEMDDKRIVRLPYENYPFMTHSWGTTMHKSQGSEYECVIIVLSKEHEFMLNRKTLYTGVTRGKKIVFLVGSKEALVNAITKSAGSINTDNVEAKNVERLTLLPIKIADRLCNDSPNVMFQELSDNYNKNNKIPERKHTIDLDSIVLPF